MARELGRDSVDQKATTTKEVPIRWMAPETWSRDGNVMYSFKTDVFAFGALIFEMFAQQRPYDEVKNNTVVSQMIQQSKPLILPVHSAVPAPAGIADVMAQCRKASPQHRPTMRELGLAIAHLMTIK